MWFGGLIRRHIAGYHVYLGAGRAKSLVPVKSLVCFPVSLAQRFNTVHFLFVFLGDGKNASSRALNKSSAWVALEKSSLPRGHSSCGMELIFTRSILLKSIGFTGFLHRHNVEFTRVDLAVSAARFRPQTYSPGRER